MGNEGDDGNCAICIWSSHGFAREISFARKSLGGGTRFNPRERQQSIIQPPPQVAVYKRVWKVRLTLSNQMLSMMHRLRIR
jgi:hypothetical protein